MEDLAYSSAGEIALAIRRREVSPVEQLDEAAETTVRAGLVDGLPVGMPLISRLGAEDDVLAASAALERVRPWADSYSIPAGRALQR